MHPPYDWQSSPPPLAPAPPRRGALTFLLVILLGLLVFLLYRQTGFSLFNGPQTLFNYDSGTTFVAFIAVRGRHCRVERSDARSRSCRRRYGRLR